jgi:hypothetical protein
VGVLIGGLLTIIGQVLISWLQGRREYRKEKHVARTIARLQQDSFWTFQNYAARALRSGRLTSDDIDPRYSPSREDVQVMASVLDSESWRLYISAIRLQAECLLRSTKARTSALSEDEQHRLLAAYALVDAARHVISKVSGIEPSPHRFGNLTMTADEIRQAFSDHHLLLERTPAWIDRILNHQVRSAG